MLEGGSRFKIMKVRPGLLQQALK